MMTFLPYADFAESAVVLDNKRLGKQRVEVLQILRMLADTTGRWKNQPIVKMWRGYEPALALYGVFICKAWTAKGFKDTCFDKIMYERAKHFSHREFEMPVWFGNMQFHLSHQAMLLKKKPEYYSEFFTNVPKFDDYIWPFRYGPWTKA